MRYPNGHSKPGARKNPVNYANRGKHLEQRINTVNEHYQYLNMAMIQFIQTPMRQTTGPDGNKIWIHGEKSTVDFVGTMAGGRAVAFDAKETKNKTRFELKNIKAHQIEFLEHFQKLGGAAFFIIEFTYHNKIYFAPLDDIKPLWYKAGVSERRNKSIPYDWFWGKREIKPGRGVALDYLAHI